MLTNVPGWIPTGGGLRDEDRTRRHRLLTLILGSTVPGLTLFGAVGEGLTTAWLVTVLLVLPCVVAAARLPGRRIPSIFVALGFTAACGGFVTMCHGLTEAHFTFFIVVAALALYRDWAPFGMFLVATTFHHAVFGSVLDHSTYDHHTAEQHPLVWALLHAAAVLLTAVFQVVAWGLTESEERRAQENLDESQAQVSIAFDETPVPMAMIAPDGVLLRTNAAYRSWLRLPDELPAGFSVPDVPLELIDSDLPTMFEELVGQRSMTSTREYRRIDDGTHIWIEVHSAALHDSTGRLRLIFVHCLDVTESRRHEEELRRQVRHDSLTGLLSRAAFETDLVTLLSDRPEPAGVLYMDVDRFKSINDGNGHATGDAVLKALADRIGAIMPAGALVARLGGDEFVVALPGGAESGAAAGNTLLAALADPLTVEDSHVQVSVSIGLAVAESAGQAEQAVLSADTAMYAAKRDGGNRLHVFSDQMRIAVHNRIEAEARLREALAGRREDTLPVWFQPIVSADGSLIGAETLVRMRMPDGTILGPVHFVPAAEETGLIVPLGEHVLIMALRQLVTWRDDLGYVSVNVSPRQLAEPDFVPLLADLLAASPEVDPSRLVLEITETALLGSSVDVRERLETIKRLGVRIALDDFGTGYSSLTWLQSVPADVVKLDRSFVAGLSADPRKSSIIQAVLWLARSLGMSVVAEGVEEEADWHALREAGCSSLQGYLFGRPVPPEEFEATQLHRSRMATTP